MISGPIIGLIVVVLAYILGIMVSIKCCKPDVNNMGSSSGSPQSHGDMLDRRYDIFILPISEDYAHYPAFGIPRPTLIGQQHLRNELEGEALGPAPAYEEPPAYEDCINNSLV